MKRAIVIENDSMPPNSIDVYLENIYEEGDTTKEINYAQSNKPVILSSTKTMSELTVEGDRFIILGSSTFQDKDQAIELLKWFKTLPVKPELHFENACYSVSKLIAGPSWTIDKELKTLVEEFLDEGLVYDFTVSQDDEYRGVKLVTRENIN